MLRALAVALVALAVASCAPPERPTPEAVVTPPAAPLPPTVQPPQPNDAEAAATKRRPGARAPIPTRPLNVNADCRFKDETGTSGRLLLKVSDAEVQSFFAEVTMPKHGVCRFALAEFAQAERLPNVRLKALGNGCSVRMWEQPPQVTVAFNGCAALCSGKAVDYLWPILVDTKVGQCS